MTVRSVSGQSAKFKILLIPFGANPPNFVPAKFPRHTVVYLLEFIIIQYYTYYIHHIYAVIYTVEASIEE